MRDNIFMYILNNNKQDKIDLCKILIGNGNQSKKHFNPRFTGHPMDPWRRFQIRICFAIWSKNNFVNNQNGVPYISTF